MSEFIPTTEQVRGQFVFVEHFDNWLAQHDAETVAAAEERIIEFLKDKCECTEWMLADAWAPEGQTLFCKWHKLIHEIKGDDK